MRFIGGRFGTVVDGEATAAPSSVYSSSDQYWMEKNEAWASVPFEATGGAKYTPGNGFVYHVYLFGDGATTFDVTGGGEVEILLVAGGGAGGGGYYAGGGGGGQIVEGVAVDLSPENYNVKVGAGGTGVSSASSLAADGNHTFFGNPTNSLAVVAAGGGGGGSGPGLNNNGTPGGSGGGSSYYVSPGQGTAVGLPGLNPTIGSIPGSWTAYGNASATSRGSGTVGGGGGGAGAQAVTTTGGAGKAMGRWPSGVLPAISPVNPFMGPSGDAYAGGGGAGASGAGSPLGGGGAAGGSTGTDGKDMLGAGGGGSSAPTTTVHSGDGGDGVLIIRYPV